MTQPEASALFVMVHKDHELWCFLFVTLFNLQGACRFRRNIAIITDRRAFVNCFFRIFSILSFAASPAPSLSHSFVRIPNSPGKVNPLLHNLYIFSFSTFFCPLIRPLSHRHPNNFNISHQLFLWILFRIAVLSRHFHRSHLFFAKKTCGISSEIPQAIDPFYRCSARKNSAISPGPVWAPMMGPSSRISTSLG